MARASKYSKANHPDTEDIIEICPPEKEAEPSIGKENNYDDPGEDIEEIEVLENNVNLLNSSRNESATDSRQPLRNWSGTRSSSRSSYSSSAASLDDVTAHPVSRL